MFKNGDKQKNCSRCIKIRMYAFLILEKEISKKTVPGFLKFIRIVFLIFEKGISKKLCQVS